LIAGILSATGNISKCLSNSIQNLDLQLHTCTHIELKMSIIPSTCNPELPVYYYRLFYSRPYDIRVIIIIRIIIIIMLIFKLFLAEYWIRCSWWWHSYSFYNQLNCCKNLYKNKHNNNNNNNNKYFSLPIVKICLNTLQMMSSFTLCCPKIVPSCDLPFVINFVVSCLPHVTYELIRHFLIKILYWIINSKV
jgi:hypothetical protein